MPKLEKNPTKNKQKNKTKQTKNQQKKTKKNKQQNKAKHQTKKQKQTSKKQKKNNPTSKKHPTTYFEQLFSPLAKHIINLPISMGAHNENKMCVCFVLFWFLIYFISRRLQHNSDHYAW